MDVETLDGRHRASIPEGKLETVIPALGKRVRVVGGAKRGSRATLLTLNIDAFSAQIKLDETGEVVDGVAYEDICKER